MCSGDRRFKQSPVTVRASCWCGSQIDQVCVAVIRGIPIGGSGMLAVACPVTFRQGVGRSGRVGMSASSAVVQLSQ